MTILTKPNSGAKLCPKPINPENVENGAVIEQDENINSDKLLLIRERSRYFTGSTLLLILATLCLACMGLLIGLVVYRRAQLQRMHFRGMCNLPYDGNFDDNKDVLLALNRRFQDLENYSAEKLQNLFDDQNDRNFFREEFDLDFTDDNAYAKINVPDFQDGRVGRFLHDFKGNQTAIIDESSKRCFVMPLDREAVLPPKSLADVILKMYMGYYDINIKQIQKSMHVIPDEVTDLTTISPNIQMACESMSIYRLEKIVDGVVKRSADPGDKKEFVEFSGHYITYGLYNLNGLNGNQKK